LVNVDALGFKYLGAVNQGLINGPSPLPFLSRFILEQFLKQNNKPVPYLRKTTELKNLTKKGSGNYSF